MLRTSQRFRNLLPRSIKLILRELSAFVLFSDVSSIFRFVRASHPTLAKRGPEKVTLRIRQLQNCNFTVRTQGTDCSVVFACLVHQFHLPPCHLSTSDHLLFLDLGANIGCTMAHLACLYSNAQIIGVELDGENAALCRKNITPWKNRCSVVEAGVWHQDGEIRYDRPKNQEHGYSIVERPDEDQPTARAITINSLLEQYCPTGCIVDYLKMDIEGAERHVLQRATEWADRVRCLKIELHDYTHSECIADLQKLGFQATIDNDHNLCVVGFRQ